MGFFFLNSNLFPINPRKKAPSRNNCYSFELSLEHQVIDGLSMIKLETTISKIIRHQDLELSLQFDEKKYVKNNLYE